MHVPIRLAICQGRAKAKHARRTAYERGPQARRMTSIGHAHVSRQTDSRTSLALNLEQTRTVHAAKRYSECVLPRTGTWFVTSRGPFELGVASRGRR